MATEAMNQFRITRQDGTMINTVSANMLSAITLYDTVDNPVTQGLRTGVSLQVILPDTPTQITFRTVIGGAGASTAGNTATPTEFTVTDGSTVIFEATPVAGYNFTGWWVGRDPSAGTPDSTALIASLPIHSAISVSADVVVTAQFAAIVP